MVGGRFKLRWLYELLFSLELMLSLLRPGLKDPIPPPKLEWYAASVLGVLDLFSRVAVIVDYG